MYDAAAARETVNVGPGTAIESFRFARNYWYRSDDPARAAPKLPVPEDAPVAGGDPRFRDAERGDYRLAEGSPAHGHGADSYSPASR